jgi:hypothetical protein
MEYQKHLKIVMRMMLIDSLDSGDSEYDLDYKYNEEESDNDNIITQNEIDWYKGWNKYYKWDENKKEYTTNIKMPQEFVSYSIEKIKKVEKRKSKEHNLKRKHLAALYTNFKPDNFDEIEDYEIKWTNIYNKLSNYLYIFN